MADYRLTPNADVVYRFLDKAHIPRDTLNPDWIAYQDWLNGGNTPDPAPTFVDPRLQAYLGDADRNEWINQLKTATLAQIETFVRAKINTGVVVDLPTAKNCLVRIETALVIVAKLIALDLQR